MTASALPTPAPRAILVPLDGSPAAEAILPAATLLAQRLPASLTLLHTLERNAPARVHGERHLTREDDAEAYLRGMAERLTAAGLTVQWHVHVAPVGNVPRSIATHAAEDGAALILLSTHPVTDPRTWLMGAVAQGVIRYAAPPVLLLRSEGGKSAAFDPAEVIVALDSERQGEVAIPAALQLATALAIPLRLLAVVPTVETMPGDQAIAARLLPTAAAAALNLEAEAMVMALQQMASTLRTTHPTTTIIPEVARGDPAVVMTTSARARRGVLALATHGRAGLEALWSGSIGSRIVARGDGPFLLVHPEPASATSGDGVLEC